MLKGWPMKDCFNNIIYFIYFCMSMLRGLYLFLVFVFFLWLSVWSFLIYSLFFYKVQRWFCIYHHLVIVSSSYCQLEYYFLCYWFLWTKYNSLAKAVLHPYQYKVWNRDVYQCKYFFIKSKALLTWEVIFGIFPQVRKNYIYNKRCQCWI